MSFYGGNAGQHFYIANVFSSYETMINNQMIFNNQFVLLCFDSANKFNIPTAITELYNLNESTDKSTLWIKHDNQFKYAGKVGNFVPSIDSNGNWSIGGVSMNESAVPDQLYLKVPYEYKDEKLVYIPDADGKCYIKYAYDKKGLTNDTITTDWYNLVEITGLHTFESFVETVEALEETIKEQHDTVLDKTNLIHILTELNKSYTEGTGQFVSTEEIGYNWVIPEGYYGDEIEKRQNQEVDNAKYYYEHAMAASKEIQTLENVIGEYRNDITDALRLNETLTTDEKLDAWRTMVTAELSAAARETMNPKTEQPLLTERLNKFLYQFDTFAEMRNCTLLRPGDTCVTFGISRLGDGHSLLFRVYENDEDMAASNDLKLIEGKYYISLPGGGSELAEKQILKNGYVAYSISMFSGLGSGGGGDGTGGASKGSIITTFTTEAVAIGSEVEIPIEWSGKVSGDGQLYVFERAQNSSAATQILYEKDFPEGHQTFVWKAVNEGRRTLIVYVIDRGNNTTNQLRINVVVGGLKAQLNSEDDKHFTYGQTVPYGDFEINSIKTGEVSINYTINNISQPTKKVQVEANKIKIETLLFNNLAPGGYSVNLTFSQSGLPDVKLNYSFSVIEVGKVSVIVNFDVSEAFPSNKPIRLTYKNYYQSITSFQNIFYIGGGDLEISDADYIDSTGRKYKKISQKEAGVNQEEFTIDPIVEKLNENQTYYLMVEAFCTYYTSIKGSISNPIAFKVTYAQEDLFDISSWGGSSLLYYFDARQGQTNQDPNRTIWKNLAGRYNAVIEKNPGAIVMRLNENSFNWTTNGWSPIGHENSLYFNGTAYAHLENIDDDCDEEGLDSHRFLPTDGSLLGVFNENDIETKKGSGVTFSFYLKTEDSGVDARLFELPFVSGDGEIGISINTSEAKMSTSMADYFGITTRFEPGEKTHITFVYERIGTTRYRPDPEEEDTISSGLARIYINGICRAAAVVTSDFFKDQKFITDLARFNTCLNDPYVSSTDPLYGMKKYDQGAFELYSVKIFNKGLNHDEVLYNYIHDLADEELQKTELAFNKLNGYTITNPEICLYPEDGNLSNITKDISKTMPVTYQPSTDINSRIRYEACKVSWQGTSSIGYPIKNYKIKFGEYDDEGKRKDVKLQLDANNNLVRQGNAADKKSLFGKPEKTYTLKADYMNSSHCHNTCNAKFVNDTGLLSKYSLTPAQVLDICELNEEELKRIDADKYEPILEAVAAGEYYFKNPDNSYRPYKLSDFPDSIALQTRNTIYGIPCELYANLKNSQGDFKPVFLGLYNFNNDKGNLDTFGLYRDDGEVARFPGCTSFEIAANSNSTSGAFKKRQLVKRIKLLNGNPELDKNGDPIVLGYYATNLETQYALASNGKTYEIILTEASRMPSSPCECVKYTLDTNTWSLSLTSWDLREFIPKNALIEVTGTDEEIVRQVWGEQAGEENINSVLTSYKNLLTAYYTSDFELRAPDNDDYYADIHKDTKDIPTNEYYDEYNKIKSLVDWVNGADAATFKNEFKDHFDLETTLNYYVFVMTVGLIDNFGKNLMVNTWGCDKNGKIPYIYYEDTDGTKYHKVRQFSKKDKDLNDLGQYLYGYSTCVANNDDKIIIYGMNSDGSINKDNIIELPGDYHSWNCSTYQIIDAIKYGCWQKITDETRYIWYPHPYDLDSCLGLDNMGYRRYGTDIEMLPNNPLEGFNDYYEHKFFVNSSPFNTATSNLWYKFYKNFSAEIAERYRLLRANGIININKFNEFYYENEIKMFNRQKYNEDMWFKYMDGNSVGVIVGGEGKTANPTTYIHMCHGDDWSRTRSWISKRINFLDSLYQYEAMSSAVVIRGSQGDYKLKINVYDPQYVAIAWSNKKSESGEAQKIIWRDPQDQSQLYGLVYDVYSLSDPSNIKYGFIKVTYSTQKQEYNFNSYLYKREADGVSYTQAYDETGVYYEVYEVEKNNSKVFSDWRPNLTKKSYQYYTYWVSDILSSNQGSFQNQKIGEQYEAKKDNYQRIRLVKPFVEYQNSSTTDDQEVMIYGAFNIKQIDGLTSLNPKVLKLQSAYNLLEVECHGSEYSDLDLSALRRLRKIDVSDSSNLDGELNIANMPHLTDLNISLTNISSIKFPDNGGNLQALHLNSSINNLNLINQQQLESVTLEASLSSNSVSTSVAIKDFGMISTINLTNCPKLSFNFAAIGYDNINEKYYSKTLAWDNVLTEYVDHYGIFSMFKKLTNLTLTNSCLYDAKSNPRGVGKDNKMILSIPKGSAITGTATGASEQETYSILSYVDLQNMPIIKTFVINADKYYSSLAQTEFTVSSVAFPGMGLQNGAKFLLNEQVEAIEIYGDGSNSIYMPCVNDWRNFKGLKKVSFNNIKITNKEKRKNSKNGADINNLSIILPDTPSLREIVFNEFKHDQTNEISSIFFGDITTNISDYISTKSGLVEETNFIHNTIDLSNKNIPSLKMNFTGFQKIETVRGLDQLILDIENNENIPKITTFDSFFANCNNLNALQNSKGQTFDFIDRNKKSWNKFKKNPSFKNMFYKCEKLTWDSIKEFLENYGPINNLENIDENNYYELQDASQMFYNCLGLNKLNLQFSAMGKLKTLKGLAQNCRNLEQFNLTLYNTDGLSDMSNLLSQADSQVQNKLKEFNLSVYYQDNIDMRNKGLCTVTTMENMLNNCNSLEEFDMSDWSIENLISLKAFCQNATSLTSLGLRQNYNFHKLNTLQNAFTGCDKLTKFTTADNDISVWNFETPISLQSLFSGCDSLDITFLKDWNMNNVTNIAYFLQEAGGPESVELDISKWNVTQIIDASAAFKAAKIKALKTELKTDALSFKALASAGEMFRKTSLKYIDSSIIPDSAPLTSLNGIFAECKALTSIGEGYKNWNVSNVKTFSETFMETQLTELDLREWNFNSATIYEGMFKSCSVLEDIDGLEKLFPSTVLKTGATISNIFNGCTALKQSTLEKTSKWNIFDGENECVITDLSGVYAGCKSLTAMTSMDENYFSIYLTFLWPEKKFNKVSSINSLFAGCPIVSITLPEMNKISSAISCFSGCSLLTFLDLSKVNFAACDTDKLKEWLKNCSSLQTIKFMKANEEKNIGFLKCDIDLSPLNFTNIDSSFISLGERITGAYEKNNTGVVGNTDTYAISQAIQYSKKDVNPSASDAANDLNYPNINVNSNQKNSFTSKENYKNWDGSAYEHEAAYILNKKHWFMGVVNNS